MKKTRTEESKRLRLDPGVSSAASAQGPVSAEPEPMEVSASSEPASSSKRPYPGGRDPEGGEEEMVTNLLLTLRTGYSASVAGEPYPVCEERLDTDIYGKFETSYWDDVSGKPLRPELVQEARKEEVPEVRRLSPHDGWISIRRTRRRRSIAADWWPVNSRSVTGGVYPMVAKSPPGRISMLLCHPSVLCESCSPSPQPERHRTWMERCAICQRTNAWSSWTSRRRISGPMRVDVCSSSFPLKLAWTPPYVGLLRKSLYGTRDAPANWEATILRVMTQLGFVRGRSNSCLYYHPLREIQVEVHGDDFTGLGTKAELEWFAEELGKHWTVEVRGYLGPPGMVGTQQSIDILNRLVSWTSRGIELEADPRHVDIILKEVGCEGAKVTTALVKEKIEQVEEAEPLSSEDASWYRSVSMRLAYLSQDRPDLQVPAKELAKGLKSPTTAHMMMLKRGARYLRASPRLVHLFPYQSCIHRITAWVDADHAGCLRSRKSTTGYCLRLGSSTIKTGCKSQAVIALSSGEAECYGLVSAACNALGEQSTLKDWGIFLPIQSWMDASTGLSMGSRHGLGRVKHIDTVFLWVQDAVSNGKISLGKKHTDEMLADLLTKPLDRSRIQYLLSGMNYHYTEGRHHLALNV